MAQPASARQVKPAPLSELRPVITYDAKHDLSAPLKTLSDKQPRMTQTFEERPLRTLPKSQTATAQPSAPDMALQDVLVTGKMPSAAANFDGINNLASVAPPDTQGDIGYDPVSGKKYYMQWVNLHIQAWDVTNPAAPVALFASPMTGNTLWDGFGGRCESDNDGDPIVLYDETANRWMISQFSVSSTPYYNCIAISQTGDPSGAYYRYAFLYSNTKMNDYPKYGVWNDGYYMTVNQFENDSSPWAGAGVAVYERDQMLTGGTARQVIFDLENVSSAFGGMLPVDFEGTPPPAGSPAYFVEVDDSSSGLGAVDQMRIWQFSANWATNTFTFGLSGWPNQVLAVSNFTPLCSSTQSCIPQPNTQRLDALGDRLMYRLAYRNLGAGVQRMVVNHTVDAGSGRAGVRWYELESADTTWAITQQGTYAGDTPTSDTNHRWMGSIAIDRMGNLALGYSMSSSSRNPSIGLVGRLTGDPVNTLPQGEAVVFSGASAQSGTYRWGDYSSMSVDPVDGCTFWFTTEYSGGSWNWRTRIVSFRYPTCTAQALGSISGTVRVTDTLAPIEGAQVSAGAYTATTALDGSYTLSLPVGVYDVTPSAFGYQSATTNAVSVTENGTTPVDFSLAVATLHQVSGVVSEALSGERTQPLYARLTITGLSGDVYTHPQTGAYSVMLPEGGTYTLTVNSVLPGYETATADVLVSGAMTKNFTLSVDTTACDAPGYGWVGGFGENFDGVSAGNLPANWSSASISGAPVWNTSAGTSHPAGYAAVSPPNVAYFNSYDFQSGSARLYYTLPFDMTAIANDQVIFQMFHDPSYASNHDTLQVAVSTNGGTNWNTVGSVYDRVGATAQWESHTVNLSAYSAATSLLIGFIAISAYGNDIHIDDVVVGSPVCTRSTGSMLMGNVLDTNTGLPIDGAVIQTPGAADLVSGPTPDDDALSGGFFYGFGRDGAATAVASRLNYVADSQAIAPVDGENVWVDFGLDAGVLDAAPLTYSVTLPMDASDARTLSLENTGTSGLAYAIKEINLPQVTVPVDLDPDPVMRHLGPKNFNKTSLSGIAYYLPRERSAPRFNILAAGDLISSFPSGLAAPWGVGVDQTTATLWAGNISASGGDNFNYEFSTAGVATGKKIDTSSWVSVYAADMAYDPVHGTLWQVNVGGDNCVHEMDPDTMVATGSSICPTFGTSERGLAYDPASDTFFAGSWNDTLIKRFNRNGDILEQVNVSLPIAGLAYNPSTAHLFVANSGTSVSYDISVLDVNAGYANLGGFNVAALNGGEAGLEFACDGRLWAANQVTKAVLEIDSGETGVCEYAAIPWLHEAPASGTLLSGAAESITLTFDATGIQPGVYNAQLKLVNDTPYSVSDVNVQLTVTPPPNYGTVAGIANGLAVCDAPGAALQGATVEARNSANALVATITTGADGSYAFTGPVAGNAYTLSISKAGYKSAVETVMLVDGGSITRDVTLRRDAPCISVAPTSLETTLLQGATDSQSLALTNTGAAGTSFTFSFDGEEQAEGFEDAAFPPAGWTRQVANSGATWTASTDYIHSGERGAIINWGYNQNEWLLTPEYDLTSATLSLWSSGSVDWCRTTYNNCDLNVWLVVGAPGGGDDILVGKLEDSWAGNFVWSQSSYVLDSLLPDGPIRIGFQYLGADAADAAIDDVALTNVVANVSWLAMNPVTGSLAADSGSTNTAANFSAVGLEPGDYTTHVFVADHAARKVNVPVTLHVAKNFSPTAVDDSYSIEHGASLIVAAGEGVLINDTDPEDNPLTAVLVAGPAFGALTLDPNGSITYTPAVNFFGLDIFTYRCNDGLSNSNIASVIIASPSMRLRIYLPAIFRITR